MNFKCRTITALTFLMVSMSISGCGKSPEAHLREGAAMLERGYPKGAIVELKNTLQQLPNNGEARLLLGRAYMALESFAEAEKELSRARQIGAPEEQVIPLLAKTYLKMGESQKVLDMGIPPGRLGRESLAALQAVRAEAQLRLGNQAGADQAIATAVQADPNQPDLLFLQARLALSKAENAQAMALLDRALQRHPKNLDILYLKAALLHDDGQTDESLKIYQQIVAHSPNQFRAHLAMFSQHLQAKHTAAAEQALHAAEKIDARVPLVKYARGVFELHRDNLDKASNAFLDVLRVTPNHLPSILAHAMVSFSQGHFEQSLNGAGKVLAALPDNLIAAKVLAQSQIRIGDIKGALKTLDPLLLKHPLDAKLLALAGEAHLQAKDYERAMSYLDKAEALEPTSTDVKVQKATLHLATGDSRSAIVDLEKAITLSEKPGQVDLALVMLHLRGKEYDNALQAIQTLEKKLPTNPVTYNLRAIALEGKKDVPGARSALERALAIQPNFFPAALKLARLDMQSNKPQAARKRFEDALGADEKNVRAMLAMADLALAENKENEFIGWLEKAIKADPQTLTASIRLINHYLAKKEPVKALSQAKKAAITNPYSFSALSLLGATQMSVGDKAASVETYTRMTQLAPRSPEAYLGLAIAQIGNRQLDAARGSLRQALQIQPDFIKAQDAMIRLELDDKKPESALAIARQIQTQHPTSSAGFDREADILFSLKRYPQAIKAYELALAKGTGTGGFIRLSSALYASGNTKAAEQRIASWIKQHPSDPLARTYAARFFTQTNNSSQAIAQYEELLKLKPDDASALNNLANLYLREKDARALATAERAVKLAPNNPAFQDTLGWILLENGQVPRSLELLSKAATRLPKIGATRYHYGVALMRSGKHAEAKREFSAAVASGLDQPELGEAKALLKSL